MENSPLSTTNPYKKTPKSQSTLPLEPRQGSGQNDPHAPYKPQPPRPEDFNEAKEGVGERPAAPQGGASGNQPGATPRGTVNFTEQPAPRRYEAPASYGNGTQPEPPRERPTQPPTGGMRPRPTVQYQPVQMPGNPAAQQPPRPYPTPTRPGQATRPAAYPGYRPTVPADGAGVPGGNGPRHPGGWCPPTVPPGQKKRAGGSIGLIICIVVVALVIVGVGCWWYFGYRDSHPILTDDIDVEEVATINYPDATTTADVSAQTTSPADSTAAASQTAATSQTASSPAGIGAATESTSLFNRPLTYTGTVTPGGVASLNIILFQNGRLEGTIDYSGGKSMPLFGSYTWTDNGHMMNINFTVSSPKDKTYSESWMGHSSYIKDDLAHTLTFKRINTSAGQSMTASFALRP